MIQVRQATCALVRYLARSMDKASPDGTSAGRHKIAMAASGRNPPLAAKPVFYRQLTAEEGQWRHALRLGLLSYLKCIIDFDAQVSYCTFKLGMSQKQLNRTKILGPSIDQRRFRSAHRMCAIGHDIKANRGYPSSDDARVLSR
jgi:hypothetical protein